MLFGGEVGGGGVARLGVADDGEVAAGDQRWRVVDVAEDEEWVGIEGD